MRIGIFFGGPSREREVSFAGGRTVYDNLDKDIFEPVPIFVDSFGQFIELNWQMIYKGTIRDFYPPSHLTSGHDGQYYIDSFPKLKTQATAHIGRLIEKSELKDLIDFAFLALHGRYGEDGALQSELESLGIPYSGSGVMACALGMDKYAQKRIMSKAGYDMPDMMLVKRSQWKDNPQEVVKKLKEFSDEKIVIRPSKQGSSIGVSILDDKSDQMLKDAVNSAFFIEEINASEWHNQSEEDRSKWIQEVSDVKLGLGYPIRVANDLFYNTQDLLKHLDGLDSDETCILEAIDSESAVIVESFIDGREFSCIVVRNLDGTPLALPPTEIVKQGQLFDYRSKYLPGLSRKETPISLEDSAIQKIRNTCEGLYSLLGFGCYARIDGFYTHDGKVILNDPNTTSGMLPSSFFFHQAAEIGLNPSQFLTFIIHSSLHERIEEMTTLRPYEQWIDHIEAKLNAQANAELHKKKVAVIFGGYSFERHISVESGRNIYEKLSSSQKYLPTPVFLKGNSEKYELFELPLNYMLKDNADDIRDKIDHHEIHPILELIRKEAKALTNMFAGPTSFKPSPLPFDQLKTDFDLVFIALHGRPGEDGDIQKRLEILGIPYNGSNSAVSSVTINKFDTLQLLGSHHLPTTDQWVIDKADFQYDRERWLQSIEGKFSFPLIAKPVDDGCSSAVVKVKNLEHLRTYMDAVFRENDELAPGTREALGLTWNEEFPRKNEVLIERLINRGKELLFMEITCGLITSFENGQVSIKIFEPSEALATGDVLSLEEKFLAGQGQNITPARFQTEKYDYDYISERVKQDLLKAAKILGLEGYARIDAFVKVFENGEVETYIIEINSLPGMTPATCIYHQAALEEMKPYDFIDKILTFAEQRQQKLVS